MNRDKILNELLNNKIYESILVKYLPIKNERNEFRQALWVMLCEIKPERLEELWREDKLLYYYCAIVKTQLTSSKSSWYKNYRSFGKNSEIYESDKDNRLIDNDISFDEEHNKYDLDNKLNIINKSINYHLERNPRLKLDFNLFSMKYNEEMTMREISEKLNIPLTSVFKYIRNAEELIKSYIKYKKQKIRK